MAKHRGKHNQGESKSFGPEAGVCFSGSQRSPYQDFLKRCGGDPRQLGFSTQSGDALSPGMSTSSPGYKQNKQHSNPRSSSYVPGGHNKRFPDQNRNRPQHSTLMQSDQWGKTEGSQSIQSNHRSATKSRGQGNNRRKQVWEIFFMKTEKLKYYGVP